MNEKQTLIRRLYATLLAGVIAVGVPSLLIRPFGDLKAHRSLNPLLAGADVNPAIIQIVERSCQNCHSEKTEWPWYSYVAPVSWLIEKDVHDARSHMNLSRWDDYGLEKKQELLTRLAAAVRSRQMPPARYNSFSTKFSWNKCSPPITRRNNGCSPDSPCRRSNSTISGAWPWDPERRA